MNEIEPVLNLITQLVKFQQSLNEGLQFMDAYLDNYSEDALTVKGAVWLQALEKKLSQLQLINRENPLVFKVLGESFFHSV